MAFAPKFIAPGCKTDLLILCARIGYSPPAP
jgi:hypothetical protein